MYKLLLIFFCFFSVKDLFAQAGADILKANQISNINTILIFTSQDTLSSGLYRFTRTDISMQVYHLPFLYHFDSDKRYNYFIIGNIGYSQTYLSKNIVTNQENTLNYKNYIRTVTAGLGGGIRYKLSQSLHLLGGMELIYSRTGDSSKSNDTTVQQVFNDVLDAHYSDNLSYAFFTVAEYRPTTYKFKPYVSLSYKLFQTKSSYQLQALRTFTTQSNVTTLTTGAETPALFHHNKNYLTLEGYFNSNYLGGDVEKTVEFYNYQTFGITSYWYTPEYPKYIKRFYINLDTVRSNGLEGYNIGVGFTTQF